jgi:hypothetical protein
MLENAVLQELLNEHFSVRSFTFLRYLLPFPPFKNDGCQSCFQKNNKLITNVAVSASVIMNEGKSDELQHELAREFYHLLKEVYDVGPLNVRLFVREGANCTDVGF